MSATEAYLRGGYDLGTASAREACDASRRLCETEGRFPFSSDEGARQRHVARVAELLTSSVLYPETTQDEFDRTNRDRAAWKAARQRQSLYIAR